MAATKSKRRIRRLNVKAILKKNPQVDVRKMTEAQEVIRELRRRGIPGPRYDLTSPYERGPIGRR